MDLSKLDKSEAIAARVYLRRRRKAWEHFFYLQDIKIGDWITNKIGELELVIKIMEGVDAGNFDIVIMSQPKDPNECANAYAFNVRAAEGGFMKHLMKADGHIGFRNSMNFKVKITKSAKVLYGKS